MKKDWYSKMVLTIIAVALSGLFIQHSGIITPANAATSTALPAVSQDGMIGEIRLFAGNFPPRNWAFCDGQVLAINSNQALFSILGTTYGGNGRSTFALPDLRGRSAIGVGQVSGIVNITQGQKQSYKVSNEIPAKYTDVHAKKNKGLVKRPTFIQKGALGLRYIICMQGVCPSRQ